MKFKYKKGSRVYFDDRLFIITSRKVENNINLYRISKCYGFKELNRFGKVIERVYLKVVDTLHYLKFGKAKPNFDWYVKSYKLFRPIRDCKKLNTTAIDKNPFDPGFLTNRPDNWIYEFQFLTEKELIAKYNESHESKRLCNIFVTNQLLDEVENIQMC